MYHFLDNKLHYNGKNYTAIYIVTNPAIYGMLIKHRRADKEAVLYVDSEPLVPDFFNYETEDDIENALTNVFAPGNKWRDIAILSENDINGVYFKLKVILWFYKNRRDLIKKKRVCIQYGAEGFNFLRGDYRRERLKISSNEKLDFVSDAIPKSVWNFEWHNIFNIRDFDYEVKPAIEKLNASLNNVLAVEFVCPNIADGLRPMQRALIGKIFDSNKNLVSERLINAIRKTNSALADVWYDQLIDMFWNRLINGNGNFGSIVLDSGFASSCFTEVNLSELLRAVISNRTSESDFIDSKFPLLLLNGNERSGYDFSGRIKSTHYMHSVSEICDVAIAYLSNKNFVLYPDNILGGIFGVSQYNGGAVGGRLIYKVGIEIIDSQTLSINSLPYNVSSEMLEEELLQMKKYKKLKGVDNLENNCNYRKIEILLHLSDNVSLQEVIDQLYANTSCRQVFENAPYVIKGDEIIPMTPVEVLKDSVNKAREIMRKELPDETNIDQCLIDYYQNIKNQFGSDRKCKIEGEA